jgi:hypothetical protein
MGLAALTGYRATLVQAFQGTQAGVEVAWSRTYTVIVDRAAGARALTIASTGTNEPEALWLEVDGFLYRRTGDAPCQVTPLVASESLAGWYEPAGFLAGVAGAAPVGHEVLDGVGAEHFTFDDEALGGLDPTDALGEFWIAPDGGYVLRYSLITRGGADYFGDGIEGLLTWNYTLVDANTPEPIAPPAGCPPSPAGLPQLPDAAQVTSMPGLLSYTTAAAPAEVAAFYQAQLPPLGWSPAPDAPVIGDQLARLRFTQAGQSLTLTALASDGGTAASVIWEAGSDMP